MLPAIPLSRMISTQQPRIAQLALVISVQQIRLHRSTSRFAPPAAHESLTPRAFCREVQGILRVLVEKFTSKNSNVVFEMFSSFPKDQNLCMSSVLNVCIQVAWRASRASPNALPAGQHDLPLFEPRVMS